MLSVMRPLAQQGITCYMRWNIDKQICSAVQCGFLSLFLPLICSDSSVLD